MNVASVNTLVESVVNILSHKSKQMSVRPYKEQPKSMMPVCQSLLLTMPESTIIAQDRRLTSNLFKIISLDPSTHEWNHPAWASTTCIATPFAVSNKISAYHATVGNCDSVSSMSATTWEPAAVQVYDESKDFSITLTLDTNGVSKTGLDFIIGANSWSLHWLLREKHVLSLPLQTIFHFGVRRFVKWCSQSISRSCLPHWFHWECLSIYNCRRPQERWQWWQPAWSWWLLYLYPCSNFWWTHRTRGLDSALPSALWLQDIFKYWQLPSCIVLWPSWWCHVSPALIHEEQSCTWLLCSFLAAQTGPPIMPMWRFFLLIVAHLKVWLLFPPAWSAFHLIMDPINCRLCVKPITQSSVKSQRPAPFAYQILFSTLPFRWWTYPSFGCLW